MVQPAFASGQSAPQTRALHNCLSHRPQRFHRGTQSKSLDDPPRRRVLQRLLHRRLQRLAAIMGAGWCTAEAEGGRGPRSHPTPPRATLATTATASLATHATSAGLGLALALLGTKGRGQLAVEAAAVLRHQAGEYLAGAVAPCCDLGLEADSETMLDHFETTIIQKGWQEAGLRGK